MIYSYTYSYTQIHYHTQLLAQFPVHTIVESTKPIPNLGPSWDVSSKSTDWTQSNSVRITISDNLRTCMITIISRWLTMNLEKRVMLTDRL